MAISATGGRPFHTYDLQNRKCDRHGWPNSLGRIKEFDEHEIEAEATKSRQQRDSRGAEIDHPLSVAFSATKIVCMSDGDIAAVLVPRFGERCSTSSCLKCWITSNKPFIPRKSLMASTLLNTIVLDTYVDQTVTDEEFLKGNARSVA